MNIWKILKIILKVNLSIKFKLKVAIEYNGLFHYDRDSKRLNEKSFLKAKLSKWEKILILNIDVEYFNLISSVEQNLHQNLFFIAKYIIYEFILTSLFQSAKIIFLLQYKKSFYLFL